MIRIGNFTIPVPLIKIKSDYIQTEDVIELRHFLTVVLIAVLAGLFCRESTAQSMPEEISPLERISGEAETISSIRSILIQKEGKVIGEQYFRGMRADRSANIKSASKSIISLLTGIALRQGYIDSVDQPIAPFFRDYFQANPDPVKENITVKDLLTMRAGLETTSMHNYGRWVTSDNWINYALDQPLEEEPGSGKMIYSTGSSHLLSAVITRAAGMSTRAFAEKYLFRPLNIKVGGWDRDPQGYYMGGNNLALKPPDLLKIGQLVLNGGVWEGRRIVSRTWLRDSFQSYTHSNYNPYDYGYMWWIKPVGDYDLFFAWGHGGQYIFILPELDSVVVLTSSQLHNTSRSRRYKEPVFELLRKQIIPYLESE